MGVLHNKGKPHGGQRRSRQLRGGGVRGQRRSENGKLLHGKSKKIGV